MLGGEGALRLEVLTTHGASRVEIKSGVETGVMVLTGLITTRLEMTRL